LSMNSVSIVKKKFYPEINEIEKHFQVSEEGELCIAIGGDGTFLKAAMKFDCPILHIRSEEKDSLGFRADIALSDINTVISELKQGHYFIEKYSKLRLTYRKKIFNVINDVVLYRASGRTIHFTVDYYDERGITQPLYPGVVRGDGVLFTKQIGSTAYNYFANGPILFDIEAIAVTPIAANRNFSIVSKKDFQVTVCKRQGVLEHDGVEIAKLSEGDHFTVTKSDEVVRVIRLRDREKISSKLARLESF